MKAGKIADKHEGCVYCSSGHNRNAYSIGKYGKDCNKKLLKCRHCGRIYSSTCGTVFEGSRLTADQYRQILKLMFKDVSIRDTAHTMKLSPDTVFRSRKKLIHHIDSGILKMFKELGFREPLTKGLGRYLSK